MATTIRSDSETGGPGSQGPDRGPFPHPKTLDQESSPGLEPGQDIPGGGLASGAAGLGRSWLTHAWVAFESPKEGKRQKGEIPIPGAWFLEWLDSRSHGDVPVP